MYLKTNYNNLNKTPLRITSSLFLIGIMIICTSCNSVLKNDNYGSDTFQIENFYSTIEASNFSNEELDAMGMYSTVKTLSTGNDNIVVRLIQHSAPIVGSGTLAHSWAFLEISYGDQKRVQTVYEKSPNVPRYLQLFSDGSEVYVVIAGHVTAYTPRPLFVSFWRLSETGFMESDILSTPTNISSVIVQSYGNEVIIKNFSEQLRFEGLENGWEGGFSVKNSMDTAILNIIYQENMLVVE